MNQKLLDLSTFDLAFNLASGTYNEQEKFEVLKIIKEREINPNKNLKRDVEEANTTEESSYQKIKSKKPPLPGSKAEKIQKMLDAGKTPKEILEILKKKNIKVHYPEIYRLKKKSEPA